MGLYTQRMYTLLDLLSDAAYRVQVTLVEVEPNEVFRTEFEHLSTIGGRISELAKRWES